jgi:alkylation response protein AidB-like acyl-CoA dehydrogenase
LAFSEIGSRSHFWAPLGTAAVDGDLAILDAFKSWVTSAGEADSYVWTSQASAADGASLWLVPAGAPGLTVGAAFDGLGMRGNASSPVTASAVRLPVNARLGDDGTGLDTALGVALPMFQILNASCSLGVMDAAVAKAIGHATTARLLHLDQSLADQPVTRAAIAALKLQADAASTLVADAVVALTSGRPDAPLRMLQSKALAGDTAIAVTDAAMRIGGGAAFRKEVGLERHLRDARAATVMAPTSDALREFMGRALCGMALFG